MKEENNSAYSFQIDSLFNIFSHWDQLNTSNHKVQSFELSKDYGRWSIYESERYFQVLKKLKVKKNVIRELKEALPNRAESQIRAHHQKLMRKYGSIEAIITIASRKQNRVMIEINKRLDILTEGLDKALGNIINDTEANFEKNF